MKLTNEFKINCHAIGILLTGGDDKLSQTAKSYILKWIKSQPEFYGKRRSIYSKYFTKGHECENDSIQFAAEYYGWGSVSKNTTRIENEYMTGECDVLMPNLIVDIKNSWDEDTFPLFETEIPEPKYTLQLQGYMELYQKPKSALVYTLMNAPEHLIESEARKEQYKLGFDDLEEELYQSVRAKMVFDDLDPRLRIKRFDLERSNYEIERVYAKVQQARAWIRSLPDYIMDEEIF